MLARLPPILGLIAFSVLASGAVCAASDPWSLYEQRDYFSLDAALPPPRGVEPIDLAFLRAADDAAFGRSPAAEREIQALMRRNPPAYLRAKAARLSMGLERAHYRYKAALAAIAPLLAAGPAAAGADQADLHNSALLLEALADVAPQSIEQKGGAREVEGDRAGRFAVTINGRPTRLGFDTGADFSFLSASAARIAGLKVRQIGLSVASSTGTDAPAGLAVGDMAIGGAVIRNVVFLVLPDASLTLPDGRIMNGLLGTPVLSALGAMRFDALGEMSWSGAAPSAAPNLAMEGNEVLLAAGYRDERLLCRLDTGAQNTIFYDPFYRRYPGLFADPSHRRPLSLGGASGPREIPAYRLDAIDITLTDQPVRLTGVSVMTRPIAGPEENYVLCNIGADVLSGFRAYTIDLTHRLLRLDK